MQLAHVKELEQKYLLGTYARYDVSTLKSGADITVSPPALANKCQGHLEISQVALATVVSATSR